MTPVRNPNPGFSLDDSKPTLVNSPTPARKRAGFFVPLNPETGEIDMGRANPEQIAKLQAAIGSSKPKEETKKPSPEINPALIDQFYSLLEMGIRLAGRKLLHWPPDLAAEMYFSPDKKADLIAPTKALVDEFAPAWLCDNQKFIAFGTALGIAVNDMQEKAIARYMTRVFKGEVPPPLGFKFTG